MDNDTQYRLFTFAQAQPHAQSALILIAIASLFLGLHAPFWFVIAAFACGYLDWMFTGFFMPRAAKIAGCLGVLAALAAIATLAWGM